MTNAKYEKIKKFKKVFKTELILEEDYKFWENRYNNRQKALEKFGYIEEDYESIKIKGFREDCEETCIFGYWCRSIIASDYSLNHPTYMEYKKHYQARDVDWLPKGKSYVDMNKYMEYIKNREEK
jgi:hypothetical protein